MSMEELEGALQEMEAYILKLEAHAIDQHSEESARRIAEMIQRLQEIREGLMPPKPGPQVALAEAISTLTAALKKLSLDPADERAALKTCEEFSRDRPIEPRAVAGLILFLDQLAWDYGMSNDPEVRSALENVIGRAAGALKEAGGDVFPMPGFTGPLVSLAQQRGFKAQQVLTPSNRGAGDIAHVIRRAIRLPDGGAWPPVFGISNGQWTPAVDAVDQAARTLLRSNGFAVKDLRKLFWQFVDADPAKEAALLRAALNRFWDIEGAELEKTRQRVIQALAARGISVIPLEVGSQFDALYSPVLFERKEVQSEIPRNTIVRVMRPGLIDSYGNTLQKAVVMVSTGRAG